VPQINVEGNKILSVDIFSQFQRGSGYFR